MSSSEHSTVNSADILSFCSGTKTTSTAAVLMKSMPSKNESKNLMKKNRHEDSVLSAVNTEDFSGTTDARINCSVDSQHTLFSKTFSEHSGKTISSNIFDIDTINAFLNKNVADKKLKDRNLDDQTNSE